MKLYGTLTSPFVRRVRVIAHEVGEPIERIDTASDAGLAELRTISPIAKVPVAIIDRSGGDGAVGTERWGRSGGDGAVANGTPLFDSRAIIAWLETRGWAAPADPLRESNLVNAIDAALESIIQLFYLRRDGVAIDGTPFAKRQLDRADAIFAWLVTQLSPDRTTFTGRFGVPEISVCASLDWMDFRKTYPTERAAGLSALRDAWRDRPSMAATWPPPA